MPYTVIDPPFTVSGTFGIDLDIKPGVGPVIADPIRDASGLGRLRPLEPDDVPYVTVEPQKYLVLRQSLPLVHIAHSHSLLQIPARPDARPRITFLVPRATRRRLPDAAARMVALSLAAL